MDEYIRMGAWGTMLAKIGIVLLIVLIVIGLIFCCCIPIVRSVIASRISKEMALRVTSIDKSKGWERELYGEIDQNEAEEECRPPGDRTPGGGFTCDVLVISPCEPCP